VKEGNDNGTTKPEKPNKQKLPALRLKLEMDMDRSTATAQPTFTFRASDAAKRGGKKRRGFVSHRTQRRHNGLEDRQQKIMHELTFL